MEIWAIFMEGKTVIDRPKSSAGKSATYNYAAKLELTGDSLILNDKKLTLPISLDNIRECLAITCEPVEIFPERHHAKKNRPMRVWVNELGLDILTYHGGAEIVWIIARYQAANTIDDSRVTRTGIVVNGVTLMPGMRESEIMVSGLTPLDYFVPKFSYHGAMLWFTISFKRSKDAKNRSRNRMIDRVDIHIK